MWRSAVVLIGSVGLTAYGCLAWEVLRSVTDVETPGAGGGWGMQLFGPSPKALEAAAEDRLRRSLEALNDTTTLPAERIHGYRAELAAADALLVRGLRAQPAQPRALARLAAIRWELDPPVSEEAVREELELIELASRMASSAPAIQLELGKLLLEMGRQEEAIRHVHRAVELGPSLSRQAVRLLQDRLFPPAAILAALPRHADALVALAQPYFEEGDAAGYRRVLEDALDGSRPELIRSYADACLRAHDPTRLRDRMNGLGVLPSSRAEAERLIARSRAHLVLRELARALEDARGAAAVREEDPRILEHLGQIALDARESEMALDAFREALEHVARGTASPSWRARLYRQIGQSEEAAGRPDRAYEAYRRALDLDGAEPHARRRVAHMEEEATRGATIR